MLPLNPIKAMHLDGAVFYSCYFPASGISGAVMILGVVQDRVRQVSALIPF